MKYDLIVLGGGPGGYTGAIRAAKLGMRVALIENRQVGGTCLNRGCIPTKALLRAAEVYAERSEWEELGVCASEVTFDEQKAYERKEKVVSTLRNGVEGLLKSNKIDLINGKGVLKDAHTIVVGDQSYESEFILLATGSSPAGQSATRPIEGLEFALNSDDVLQNPIEGNDIVILGAGVIGVEFASYFAFAGKNVTLLAPSDRIIRMMSKELSVQLAAVLKKQGVKILTSVKTKRITSEGIEIETDKGESFIKADAVVTAVGRTPNLEGIGLENAGLTYEKFIAVDDNMYTGKAGIYACGDIIGKIQLAHFAAASAITAVESMLGKPHSINLDVCPSCIYTLPEIASVGKKETEVEGAKVGKFLMGANGKSLIEGVNRGFIKIVTDSKDVVVGAEVFSVRGTDIIGELALAVAKGLTAEEVAGVIHPHPTVMEAVGEAADDIYGLATHMSPKRA